MSYSLGQPSRAYSDVTDEMRELAMQIEALQVHPLPSPPPTSPTPSGARRSTSTSRRRRGRSGGTSSRPQSPAPRATSLPPLIGEDDAPEVLYSTKNGGDTGHAPAMRKDRQVKSSIAPEAASKAPSVPFPSVESGGGDDKTSGSTKELVAGMLDDIARDRADRAKELEKTKDKKEHKLMIKLKPLRPGAQERFTLEIIPDERHATMWDGNDDDMYAWSGTLVVTDTKPPSHIFSMDIIKHLDIRFHAVAEPSAHPELSPAALDHAQYDAWNTRHFGHSIPPWDGTLPTPLPDPSRGIVVERSPKFVEPKNRDGPFTWLVRFWLSIPFALFAHAEHKTFVCQAKAIVQYACSPKTEVKAESISVGIERLRSERLLTVSHNGSGGR